MGWVSKNGRLVNVDNRTNLDGQPIITFEEFYKKARAEASRLGLDSNFIDYLTPDVLGNPGNQCWIW